MSLNPENVPTLEEAWELNHKEYRSPSRVEKLLKKVAKGSAFVLGIGSAFSIDAVLQSPPVYAASCGFNLGFKTIHDRIPNIVGECLVNEHYNPQNGDALQETTSGLMVWRKKDNFTAFTDGYRTWVNGPYGIQERLNTERFPWEQQQEGTSSVERPLQIKPWQNPANYAFWGPLKSAAEGNPRAAGQPSIYEVAGIYDQYAASMGKRADLQNQVKGFIDWYFNTATVAQIYLDTAGFCTGVANASASLVEEEPVDGGIGRAAKILILAIKHASDKKYMPGRDKLVKDLVEKGIPFVHKTANDSEGSWTRVVLRVDWNAGVLWESDFGRPQTSKRISDIKDEDVYVPVPQDREGLYPANELRDSVLSATYRAKSTFITDSAVIDRILSR